jgi:hypothetical protein
LPQPATAIEGRPAFKRDACPGQFIYAEDLFTKLASACRPHNAALPTLFTEDPDQLRDTLETHPPAHLRVEEGIKLYLHCVKIRITIHICTSILSL